MICCLKTGGTSTSQGRHHSALCISHSRPRSIDPYCCGSCLYIPSYRGSISQSSLFFFFSLRARLWVVKSLRTWTSYSGSYMWCKRWWLISGHSCSYRACISIDAVQENLFKKPGNNVPLRKSFKSWIIDLYNLVEFIFYFSTVKKKNWL